MTDVVSLELDQETLDAVNRQAAAHGHTLDQELRDIVRSGVRKAQSKVELIEELRRIRAMTPKGVKQTPAVKLIREDRDR